MPITLASPLNDLVIGIPVKLQISDVSGVEGYRWDIPPGSILPPGMKINDDLGFLYGVPTIEGQYAFYIREKNFATGASDHKNFVVNVIRSQGQQVINNNTTIINEAQPVPVTVDSLENWVRIGGNLPFRVVKETLDSGETRYKLSILNSNNEVIDVGYTDWN